MAEIDLRDFKPAGAEKTFGQIMDEQNGVEPQTNEENNETTQKPEGEQTQPPQEDGLQGREQEPEQTQTQETNENVNASESNAGEQTNVNPQVDTPPPSTFAQAAQNTPPPTQTTQETPTLSAEHEAYLDMLDNDQYLADAVKYYQKNKTFAPYADAMKHDYAKMDAIQVLRHQFDREYPNLSDKAKNHLFQQRVLSKYNLDEAQFDEDEVAIARELLDADASKVRNELIQEQESFRPKDLPPQKSKAEIQREIAAQQEIERNQIRGALQPFLDSKMVTIEVGDTPFNYQINNTDNLVEYAVDAQKMLQAFVTKEGTIDWNKWAKTVAFMSDPKAYEEELVKHGKSLGRKTFEEELENTSTPTTHRDNEVNVQTGHPTENKNDFMKAVRKQVKGV